MAAIVDADLNEHLLNTACHLQFPLENLKLCSSEFKFNQNSVIYYVFSRPFVFVFTY